jgi:hypothetical protein
VIDDEHCVIGVLSCNDLIRRATDTASTGRDPLEALHLLQTMAIIGRSRLAPHMKALPPHSDDRPRTPPLFAPSNDSMRRSIAVAVAARGK